MGNENTMELPEAALCVHFKAGCEGGGTIKNPLKTDIHAVYQGTSADVDPDVHPDNMDEAAQEHVFEVYDQNGNHLGTLTYFEAMDGEDAEGFFEPKAGEYIRNERTGDLEWHAEEIIDGIEYDEETNSFDIDGIGDVAIRESTAGTPTL